MEKIERSPEAVSNIQRGVTLPKLDTLDRCIEVLQIPLGYFAATMPACPNSAPSSKPGCGLSFRDLSDRDAKMAMGIPRVTKATKKKP